MSLILVRNRNRQRGSTLIEVMIALLILAVGLLGFAGMQTRGVQMARKSYSHSQAAFLADDIVERMRNNLSAVTAGNYQLALTSAVPATPFACSAAAPCSPAALASLDLNAWAQLVTAALPSAQFAVRATQVGSMNSVTVRIVYTLNADVDTSKVTTVKNSATTIDYSYELNTELPL